MSQMRIAILLHKNDTKEILQSSLITYLAEFWREDGHEVLFLFGTEEFISADILIVHVDLTIVPDSYLEFAKQYPIVLNGNVKDIRKSTISKILLNQDDEKNFLKKLCGLPLCITVKEIFFLGIY